MIFILVFPALMLGFILGQYRACRDYEPLLERMMACLEQLAAQRSGGEK